MKSDDTKESLLQRVTEMIAAMKNLQSQIEALKRGGAPDDDKYFP